MADERENQTYGSFDSEEFIRRAAHDLKGPLNRISGFTDLVTRLHGDTLSPQALEYLDIFHRSSERAARLVEDLAQFLRTLSAEMETGPVDLNAAAETALATLPDSKSARLADITVSALPAVEGDAAMLTAVFSVVIDNAIRHNDADTPALAIAGGRDGDYLSVSFTDNGPGIASEHLDKIFDPLVSLRENDAHSGLGLTLARAVMRRHDGVIDLLSAPGKGTVVTLLFRR
jgi:signal transduction histidine kinase